MTAPLRAPPALVGVLHEIALDYPWHSSSVLALPNGVRSSLRAIRSSCAFMARVIDDFLDLAAISRSR